MPLSSQSMHVLLGAVGVASLFTAFRAAAKAEERQTQMAAQRVVRMQTDVSDRDAARQREIDSSRRRSEELIRSALIVRGIYPGGDPMDPIYASQAQRRSGRF